MASGAHLSKQAADQISGYGAIVGMVLTLPVVGTTVWLHVHALSVDRERPVLPRCERGN